MKLRVFIFTIIIFLLSSKTTMWSQNKIHFADISIDAATQRANIENKNIFVDTYAPWCGPCKIMDIHFQDKEIINYFNRHFINVKINTDTPYGKEVSSKYQIAFLPTILILTKDGDTRFKVDKLVNRDELLSLAKYAIEGPVAPRPTAPPPPPKKEIVKVEPAPKAKKILKKPAVKKAIEVKEEPEEKILYVLDPNATDLPPEILYEEAYLRLQLNDGSSTAAADKYLATQEDWNTEKNLKFIYDFLYDTDSEEFEYFIANKSKFQEFISDEKIERSIKILVENKLYQGIPRPDFNRSKYLLSLINEEQSEKNNYHYFLNRLHDEGKKEEFNNLYDEYCKIYDKINQEISINFITGQLANKTSKSKYKSYVSLLSKIDSPTENYHLLLLYSKLYLGLSDKDNAILNANKAIEKGQQDKIDVREAKQILKDIKEL